MIVGGGATRAADLYWLRLAYVGGADRFEAERESRGFAGMGKCADCCKTCCYSTPFGTIFGLSVTVVGLVGFLSSSIYSVVKVEASPDLKNHTTVLASLVGGVAGSTTIPLTLATLLAYCSTGYVRDELYHPFVKACVSTFCSAIVIILTFVYFLFWLGLIVVFSMVMAVYVQLNIGCEKYDNRENIGNTCTTLLTAEDAFFQTCGDLDNICDDGRKVGLSLAISLAFALLVVMGLVLVLIVQGANFIRVKESDKRSYRPKGNY